MIGANEGVAREKAMAPLLFAGAIACVDGF